MERCPSGLRCGSRKSVRGNTLRGFESHPLRFFEKYLSRIHLKCTPCNLTTGFICTDTLIILDSPLCEGVFRSEKLSVPKKSNWKTGLFPDCTDNLIISE